MESKKISFGFMKTKKAEKVVIEEKKDYIECLEEKSIKVVGGETIEEKAPLVIPLKPNTLITAERLQQIAEEVESGVYEIGVKNEPEESVPETPVNESLDQMVIRELLQESKKEVKTENSSLTVPINTLGGQKESTLDDYDSVPIQDFGLAMLRGMGWQPGKEKLKYKEPQLRPKGLGLGADKVVKENKKKALASSNNKNDDKELMIIKNAYVKITSGKYTGFYGKVLSLDDDNGRVMVDITVKKETVSLSEFMMHAVTKSEYDKQSKVINSEQYEEYKNKEDTQKKRSQDSKHREIQSTSKSAEYKEDLKIREDESDRRGDRKDDKRESRRDDSRDKKRDDRRDDWRESRRDNRRLDDKDVERSNGKSRDLVRNRDLSRSSDDRSREREPRVMKKRYSSNESLSSEAESKIKESKRRQKSSESSDSSDSDSKKKHKKSKKHKRDIDKKRKGKKKRRDRDRSPNYKKHRK